MYLTLVVHLTLGPLDHTAFHLSRKMFFEQIYNSIAIVYKISVFNMTNRFLRGSNSQVNMPELLQILKISRNTTDKGRYLVKLIIQFYYQDYSAFWSCTDKEWHESSSPANLCYFVSFSNDRRYVENCERQKRLLQSAACYNDSVTYFAFTNVNFKQLKRNHSFVQGLHQINTSFTKGISQIHRFLGYTSLKNSAWTIITVMQRCISDS